MVSQGIYSDVKGGSSVRATRRRAGTLTSLQKPILRFLTCSRDSSIPPRSKNGSQQKYNIFAELVIKSAKFGSARSNFITNLPKTLITMKILLRIPRASLGRFRSSCKDPLTGCTLILEGLFRHFPG